jgi:mannose-6-phosphate isomerase
MQGAMPRHPVPPTAAADAAFAWLRDEAWPVWLAHGVDWRRRAFHEHLHHASLTCDAGFRRLRVVTRQVHAFSEAHGWGVPRAAEAVELGLAFLRRHARGEDGGYANRFDLDGRFTDSRRDTYDHAFVLLALASASRVLPPAALRREALDLAGFLDGRLAHPAGGYAEGLPPTLPRRQNPHMHLLEAFLAAAEAFGEEVFAERAAALVDLFLDRLLHRPGGTLPEYFDDALAPLREGGRHAVEPGHHAEWVWLLAWARDLLGDRLARDGRIEAASAGLIAFVDRHGVNPRLGSAFDEVWDDGTPKATASRLWPQTERLKAELLRPDATEDHAARAFAALARYREGAPRGLWFESLAEDGTPAPGPAPASSLYHLTSGILFARRHLAPSLATRPADP